MTKTLVSILIITRNRSEEVKKLFSSIIKNFSVADLRFEIICLDNGSEKPLSITEIDYLHIKVFRSNTNIGLTGGRNFLAKRALGEWLFFIDDDAFIPEDTFFLNFVNFIKEYNNPKMAAIACNILEYYKPWRNLSPFPTRYLKKINLKKTVRCSYYLGGAHFIKREIFAELGGYDENLFFWGEELDFSYKLINKGYEIYYNPDLLVIHKASETKNLNGAAERFYFLRNKIYINYKYLPFYFRWISNAIWVLIYLFRTRKLKLIMKSIIEAKRMCKKTSKQTLSRNAIKYLLKNYGRLFY